MTFKATPKKNINFPLPTWRHKRWVGRPPDKLSYFFYFSTKTYVLGTQKNRLNETVLLEHPKYMFKVIGKKIITILRSKLRLTGLLG